MCVYYHKILNVFPNIEINTILEAAREDQAFQNKSSFIKAKEYVFPVLQLEAKQLPYNPSKPIYEKN